MNLLHIVGQILVVLGALIFATAALGVLRFPDTYARISAVGTAGGIGIAFVVTGALLLQPTLPDTLKALAIIVLQLATSAIGTIAIARAAALTGTRMANGRYDELQDERDANETRDP